MPNVMAKFLPENLKNLLKILSDGSFHSGEKLGQELQITRSAIWKLIHQASELQIAIDSVKGKGYRLQEPLFFLDTKLVKRHLSKTAKTTLQNIELFDQVTSTNDYLKSQTTNPLCVMSEQQTQGRGRFNRVWMTPFGKNISLSGNWQFKDDISALSGLSIVIGLGVLESLQPFVETPLKLKWPNDIIAKNKKLSGILIDLIAEANGFTKIIYGIGVNVNSSPIANTATSLRDVSGKYHDRNQISASILNAVVENLIRYEKEGFEAFMPTWNKYDYLSEQELTVHQDQRTIIGHAHGIDDRGRLLIKTPNGQVVACSSGDTTLRQRKQ